MFDDIVDRYDLVNDVMSLGLDRWWRRATADSVRAAPGDRVLDLGCGTGMLARRVASVSGASVIGVDVSDGMLRRARRTVGDFVGLVQGSAFALPFADRAFTGVVSGFVLRNLDDLPAALAEMARVVRPGGRIALVDITEPRGPLFRGAFDAYFGRAAPVVGALVGKRDAYRYLVRSLGQIPEPHALVEMLAKAGFERAGARGLTGGAVTLFTGTRGA
jgi:demethylmenaquinone methyltransferase / 2-methoxy-6-polyprenyl-1,4-benzoquinol methylase